MRHLLPVSAALWFCLAVTLVRGVESTPTPASSENTLHDRTLRLSVTKPADWHFLTGKEKRAGRHAIEYEDKVLDMILKRYVISAPIVIAKYHEPYAGLNPRVIINLLPLEEERLSDSLRAAQLHYNGLRQFLFGRIKALSYPGLTKIDGKDFGYYRVGYTLGVEKLPPFDIDQRVWLYSLPLAAVTIIAITSQEGADTSQGEIDAIIASIRFNPRR